MSNTNIPAIENPYNYLPANHAGRIVIDRETGCWRWTGGTTTAGYPQARIDGTVTYLHRFVVETAYQTRIKNGQCVDHICHNPDLTCDPATCQHRRCLNPAHLRIVTSSENTLASTKTIAGRNARKTHCHRGHEFTPETTILGTNPNGKPKRECRQCRRDREYAKRHADK